MSDPLNLEKAALRGEPSYVWRDGQRRRLDMILAAAGDRVSGRALVNGCGVGIYLQQMGKVIDDITGLDIEHERLQEAKTRGGDVVTGAGEALPFAKESFDLVLSHEVLEHVADDQAAIDEIVRILRPGGRLVLFCPNRGYPFETHGHYWRGKYHFGNTPMINYLPRPWRDRLAPHVNVYTQGELSRLFENHTVRFIQRTIIFGAYDNIIGRWPNLGKMMRGLLHWLEKTPLRRFGLSHFWVVEKVTPDPTGKPINKQT
jgi:SAM-dependent methyltransferase